MADLVQRTPSLIGGYIQGQERRNPAPGQNTHYERVSYIDGETGRAFEMDLAADVNGDRPKPGTKARLVVRAFAARVTKAKRDGTTYQTTAFDLRCIGFEPAA